MQPGISSVKFGPAYSPLIYLTVQCSEVWPVGLAYTQTVLWSSVVHLDVEDFSEELL